MGNQKSKPVKLVDNDQIKPNNDSKQANGRSDEQAIISHLSDMFSGGMNPDEDYEVIDDISDDSFDQNIPGQDANRRMESNRSAFEFPLLEQFGDFVDSITNIADREFRQMAPNEEDEPATPETTKRNLQRLTVISKKCHTTLDNCMEALATVYRALPEKKQNRIISIWGQLCNGIATFFDRFKKSVKDGLQAIKDAWNNLLIWIRSKIKAICLVAEVDG